VADAQQSLIEHVELAGRVAELLPALGRVTALLIACFEGGGRLYTFGNGGSAADSLHLAEELVARFERDRSPLPAQSLAADPTVLTCIANDWEFDEVFARQVRAFARPGDVVAGFTTSGRSANVVRGLAAARERGAATVLFTGGDGMPAAEQADHALVVPSTVTARVQEMHVLLLHLLLESVDEWADGR
jgi:D-sedoheptulose 7-phosphate isomerase